MDDKEYIRYGDVYFRGKDYERAKGMYESAHGFQVHKYGTNDNDIFVTRYKIAETCARLKQFDEALAIYNDIRERVKTLGLQDIIFYFKLEASFAISFRGRMERYHSGEDYDRLKRQFVYYEEMIEELSTRDTFEEVFKSVKEIYDAMERALRDDVNIVFLRLIRLIGLMYSLMGKYVLSAMYYEDTSQKCSSLLGPNDPLTLLSCQDTAKALKDLCEFEEHSVFNEQIFAKRIKSAERCAGVKQFNDAIHIYEDTREIAKRFGLEDITLFFELELSFAISFSDRKELYRSAEDYNRLERQFVYYEEISEKLCSTDTFKKDFFSCERTFRGKENGLGRRNVIALRIGLLIGRIYSLMENYKSSISCCVNIYRKCSIFLGKSHPLTFLSCLDTAKALRDLCHFDEAFSLLSDYRVKYRTCPKFSLKAYAEASQKMLCECGNITYELGFYSAAQMFFQNACDHRIKLHKPADSLTLHVQRMEGNIQFKTGDNANALPTLKRVFQKQARCSENRDILLTMSDIAEIMKEQRQYDRAMEIYKSMCQMSVCTQFDLILIENEIATILTKQHKVEEAVTKFKILMEKCIEMNYSTRLLTCIQNGLAMAYCEQGKYHGAIEIYEEIIKKKKEHLSFHHADILRVEYNLGRVDEKRNNLTEALNRYQRIRDLRRAIFFRAHTDCLSIENHIAEILENQNVHEEAFRIYCDLYDTIECFNGTNRLNISVVGSKMRIVAQKINDQPRLIEATNENDLQKIMGCLECGDDVNIRDNTGRAPLHIACEKNSRKAVLVLLKFGANYEIKNLNSETPVHFTRNASIVELFDQLKTVHRLVEDLEDKTLASIINSEDGSEKLESIFNAKNYKGDTPLHLVSSRSCTGKRHNCERIVELLLNNGAHIKSVTKEGYLALHCAVETDKQSVLNIFFDHISKNTPSDLSKMINDNRNIKGSTLLHFAALNNLTNIVNDLLKRGADRTVVNKLEKLPIHLARVKAVRKLLLDIKTSPN